MQHASQPKVDNATLKARRKAVSFIDNEADDDDGSNKEEEEEEEEEEEDDMSSFIVDSDDEEEEEEDDDEEDEDGYPKKANRPKSSSVKVAQESMEDGYGARSNRIMRKVGAVNDGKQKAKKKATRDSSDSDLEHLALDLESDDGQDEANVKPPAATKSILAKKKDETRTVSNEAATDDQPLEDALTQELQQASENLSAADPANQSSSSNQAPSWLNSYLNNHAQSPVPAAIPPSIPATTSLVSPDAAESANRDLLALATSTATAPIETGATNSAVAAPPIPRVLIHNTGLRSFHVSLNLDDCDRAHYADCKAPFISLSKDKCVNYPSAVAYEVDNPKNTIAPVVMRQFCLANVKVNDTGPTHQSLTCRILTPMKKPFGFPGTAKEWSRIATSTWIVENYQHATAFKSHDNLTGAALVTSLEYSLSFQTSNRVSLMSTSKSSVRFVVYLADEALPTTPDAINAATSVKAWIPIRVRSARAMNSLYMRQAANHLPDEIRPTDTLKLLKLAVASYLKIMTSKDKAALANQPIPDVEVELDLAVIKENGNAALLQRKWFVDQKGVLMDPNLLHELTKPRLAAKRSMKLTVDAPSDTEGSEDGRAPKPRKRKSAKSKPGDSESETKKKKKKKKKKRQADSDDEGDDQPHKSTKRERHSSSDRDHSADEYNDSQKPRAAAASSEPSHKKRKHASTTPSLGVVVADIMNKPADVRDAFQTILMQKHVELHGMKSLTTLKELVGRATKVELVALLLASNESFMLEWASRTATQTDKQASLLASLLD